MNALQIHITRGGLQLGSLPLDEVRELLATGFLLPTDDFCTAEHAEWLPLSALPALEKTRTASVTKKVRSALTGAAGAVRRSAVSAATKVSAAAGHQKQQVATATNRMLADFLPALQSLVRTTLGKTSRTVETALRDEAFLRKLFGAVYDVLPKPVRRFVGEDGFVEFCLKHRQKLLGKTS